MTKQLALALLFLVTPMFAHDDPHHISPVPEPASVGMLVIGGASLVAVAKAFKNRR